MFVSFDTFSISSSFRLTCFLIYLPFIQDVYFWVTKKNLFYYYHFKKIENLINYNRRNRCLLELKIFVSKFVSDKLINLYSPTNFIEQKNIFKHKDDEYFNHMIIKISLFCFSNLFRIKMWSFLTWYKYEEYHYQKTLMKKHQRLWISF